MGPYGFGYLAVGTFMSYPVGKEPELVKETERYLLT